MNTSNNPPLKEVLLLLSLSFFVAIILPAQNTFQFHHGDGLEEIGTGVIQTMEGGYIASGFTLDSTAGTNATLSKYDAFGNPIWIRSYSGPGLESDQGTHVVQAADSGYIMVGITSSYAPFDGDLFVVRTDPSGNRLWDRYYSGGTFQDYGYGVVEALDGGVVIVGFMNDASFNSDLFVAKMDANGNHLWSKYIGGSQREYGISVVATADSGFVVAGGTHSFGPGIPSATNGNIYMVKVDKNGTLVWSRTHGTSSLSENAFDLSVTNDGGFILSGSQTFSTTSHALLVKTDGMGVLQWAQMYQGSGFDEARSITQSWDGGYVIGGHSNSPEFNAIASLGQAFLIKTDPIGNMVWANSYGSQMTAEQTHEIVETADSGYVATGLFGDPVTGHTDLYLFKTNSAGITSCSTMTANPLITNPGLSSSSGGTSRNGPSGSSALFSTTTPTWFHTDACPTALGENSLALAGKLTQGNIELAWSLPPDLQANAIRIEKSISGVEFSHLISLTPPTDKEGHQGTFYDQHPHAGMNYYRIAALSTSGQTLFSNLIEIEYLSTETSYLIASPNPFKDHLHFQLEFSKNLTENHPVLLKIMDARGAVVLQQEVVSPRQPFQLTLETQGLSAGIYLAEARSLITGEQLGYRKIFKQ